jgi:hypothetical protein
VAYLQRHVSMSRFRVSIIGSVRDLIAIIRQGLNPGVNPSGARQVVPGPAVRHLIAPPVVRCRIHPRGRPAPSLPAWGRFYVCHFFPHRAQTAYRPLG